jgi:DNA polymerase/3'-5' exonuclease PolX
LRLCWCPPTAGLPHLHKIINSYWGRPISGVWPAKYTKIRGARAIDLFTCTVESFGLNFFIRTGSADYAKNALIEWKRITNGGYSQDAQLHLADGTIVPTPTEQAVFDALKRPFLAPEKRL